MICPKTALECIVCARGCLIDASEQARADFQELFAKLDSRKGPTVGKRDPDEPDDRWTLIDEADAQQELERAYPDKEWGHK